MANYNHLSTTRPHNYRQAKNQKKCCGFSKSFVAFTLNVFNFILFFSGLIILTIVLFYESSNISTQSSYHLALIRSILPAFHSLNLIYYQLVGCGILMCILAGLNLFLNIYYNAKRKNRERDLKQDIDHDIDGLMLNINSTDNFQRNSKIDTDNFIPSFALCIFIFALLLLFTIQICISGLAFISVSGRYVNSTYDEYEESLRISITDLNGKNTLEIHSSAFDVLQQSFKCCGFLSYRDYPHDGPVPQSCCKTRVLGRNCGERKHPNNIYHRGCLKMITKVVNNHTILLGTVAFAFSLVEIFGLVFSCCLYVQKVSKKY